MWWSLLAFVWPLVAGHGKMLAPTGRGSLWRLGHQIDEINWDDDQNFCGGYTIQWTANDGKCGLCGDSWHQEPRDHEVGGKFYTGILAATYQQGQIIDIVIDLVTNHKGFFEFRVCPNENYNKTEVTQECLDENLLQIVDAAGTKFHIAEETDLKEKFLLKAKLPDHLSCEHCVLQWHWTTANFWGLCENGSSLTGCGPQETYRNCADIKIEPRDKVTEDVDNTLNNFMVNYVMQPWFDDLQELQNQQRPLKENRRVFTENIAQMLHRHDEAQFRSGP